MPADAADPTNPSLAGPIAVLGLGRFGRFWASMLAVRHDVRVWSRNRRADLPATLLQLPLEEALEAPIVFLTVAISALPEVLDRIAPLLRDDATVVDTCSVKSWPVAQMEQRLPAGVDIVATHPMFGPDSAGVREDRPPIVTWPVRDRHCRYRPLLAEFDRLGMRVEERSPDDHDREAAFTQGVTHLVGRLLDQMGLRDSSIATLGYGRLIQVMEQTCNDPIELFRDLQRLNPYTREMRDRFSEALEATRHMLDDAP